MYLSDEQYASKVYGCWMGKNCGGTLGTPLEEVFGRPEPFDVWWYPQLKEGGMPNDDLEIQLIWLQMLEDRGLNVTARDFADYWLDCIVYNWDEYGLHKVSLRKGLLPPLSGWYNNWFKDCMGCPIRSEIWACIAPGQPNIAAAYAYQDAILDHAGGESVFGEMFNAALQSAAFVEPDRDRLLALGLTYIPEGCLTAKAIRTAIEAHRDGVAWQEARARVLKATPSDVAQFSPINLGFQTIGWLYGQDFGDGICKAVNCGYDTDCTGATLGATLGIIGGIESLPKKWTEPLSNRVSTNLENGGIANVRVPKDLEELTDRVCRIGRKVLAMHGAAAPALAVEPATRALWDRSPTAVEHDLGGVALTVDLPDGPAVAPGDVKHVRVSVRSRRSAKVAAELRLTMPDGWWVENGGCFLDLAPGATQTCEFAVWPSDGRHIEPINRGAVSVTQERQPALPAAPLVLLAANRWLVSPRFDGNLDTATALDSDLAPDGAEGWNLAFSPDNAIPVEPAFEGRDGVLCLRHYVYCESEQPARLALSCSAACRMWLNGAMVAEARGPGRVRPALGGDGRSAPDATLKRGWNQVFLKIAREGAPVVAHLVLSDGPPWFRGLDNVVTSRFPWEPAHSQTQGSSAERRAG